MLFQLSASNFQGGETFFPELQLAVPTKQGDMLYFENTDGNGQNDPRSVHGACAVLSEQQKLIVVGRIPGKVNKLSQLRRFIIGNSENDS